MVCYTAAKALEFARRGIRINCAAQGLTETPILDYSVRSLGQDYLDAIPKPLGRLATAEEQASVLCFLVGTGASYLSGQTIWVDGGYLAGVESGLDGTGRLDCRRGTC
ncbi:SDR family oxidoreductase [Nocardia nova]|uniref:SDR family oxidoreductase n=1 Tax=Nocardia nova TaxID=37330 RepID=UPI0026D05DB7